MYCAEPETLVVRRCPCLLNHQEQCRSLCVCRPSALRGQKLSDPVNVELQMAVSHHVVLEITPGSLKEKASALSG